MSSSISKEEYEMQLYGFTQFSVISAVKETINETLEEVLKSLCNKLVSKYQQELIEDFKTALLGAYRASLEKHTSKLEKIVEEWFSIDPAVLLPEDVIQENQYDEDYEVKLNKKCEAAKEKYLALIIMEKKLLDFVGTISSKDGILCELSAVKNVARDFEVHYAAMVETVEERINSSLITNLVSSLSLNDVKSDL